MVQNTPTVTAAPARRTAKLILTALGTTQGRFSFRPEQLLDQRR
jgi:hypothetical protein